MAVISRPKVLSSGSTITDAKIAKNLIVSPVQFPRKLSYRNFFRCPSRYKVAYGGRGSAKSWSFARALIIMGAEKPLRILCTRELQVSIKDSVYKLLVDQIDELGLSGYYEVGKGFIRSFCGTEFIFKGLRTNAQEIKSMEKIDICWVEEASSVSEASWRLLIPTIRAPGSEIWITFNPDLEDDPVYKRFITTEHPNAIVVKINFTDNPWFGNELYEEMLYDKKVDYDAYLHVWEGFCRSASDAQILYKKWRVDQFERPKGITPLFGADWGFAVDPTTLISCFVDKKKLYIEHEVYRVRCDIDHTPELFSNIPESKDYIIRADNARPETINYMKRHGFPKMKGVSKWAGSIEDGITHMRHYEEIIIHERCKHTKEEARLYSYKIDDRTGDILPVVLDKHNHCMDAIRYALEPLIVRKGARVL
jgi:phage terminase large subunit